MNNKQTLADLSQSLNRDLAKLQELLSKLSIELARLNLEHTWVVETQKTK